MSIVPVGRGGFPSYPTEQIALLKRTIASGCDDDEFELFLAVSKRTGLDPFSRQIYPVKRWSKQHNREVMTIQTGIDGFRVIAERSGRYIGQTPPEWCGDDGLWRDVWLSSEPPFAARVGAIRNGLTTPMYRVAKWSEFAQYGKSKDGGRYLMGLWATMPSVMLAKCAEAQALRAAFPNDLGGLYTDDEMGQAIEQVTPEVATVSAPMLEAAPEFVPWTDSESPEGAKGMDGTITAVSQREVRGKPMYAVSAVDNGGSSYEFLARDRAAMESARAAVRGAFVVRIGYVDTGKFRRLVSLGSIEAATDTEKLPF